MKNLLLAATAAAAVSFVASAASAQEWTGFYVGAQAGYAWGDGEQPYGSVGGPFVSTQDDVNLDGVVFGGRAGFDWQADNWVFGVMGDVEWSDRSGDDGGSGGDVNGIDINSQWSVRGRVGYLMAPETLIYATAGWTWQDVDASSPADGDVNETIDGATYGLGVEHRMGAWSGTLEYRHDDMNETRFSFPIDGYDEGITTDSDAVRVGLNYRFGG